MPVLPDPRRRWLVGIAVLAVVAVASCVAVACWAFHARAPLTLAPIAPTGATEMTTATMIDPAAWQVSCWRPFTDQPAGAASAEPITVTLFSVLRRGAVLTAALETSGGLVYAKAGETVGGITVLTVEATAVEVLVNGAKRRLEVPR